MAIELLGTTLISHISMLLGGFKQCLYAKGTVINDWQRR